MDKTYDPHAIEQALYAEWETANRFAPAGQGKPYCIMLPPPNVTGTLHMGHAFQDTLMDALMRYHRMSGDDALWQGGTDHAGIATQMVVERQLAAKNETRHGLGRDEFLKRVWAWKEESGGQITRQLRRLGASIDWSRERFTMDEGLSQSVTEVFVRLYDEGLIYRGKRLVNWDPVLHTAVSDLEVISEEENGHLWHLRYPLAEGGGDLVVATTRPETMLGDTAVAVHPEDERYKHLIGKQIALPLCNRRIPIIADDYVDPAFGTGCVKITPAHDFNDYAVGQRHELPLINVFTIDAKINDEAPEVYRGLDRYEARKRIVADFEALGLLDSVKDHKLMVPRGDRSGAVIEPFLTDQWYVDLTRDVQPDGRPGGKKRIAEPAIRVVEDGRIRFVPDNWKNTYFQWMYNLQDWCISRQLWWGHRIPAWYGTDGQVYVGRDEEDVRRKYALDPDLVLTQDEDVLDTWFSSALWPFSTLGWPEQTPELKRYYPTSVLVTGFDIIFFWVARMVMAGLYFMDDVPFREVYVTGLIRDAEGQKMSKSKGNVLDPIDLIDGIDLESLVAKRTTGLMQPQMAKKIEQATRKQFPDGIPAFGTDALRFTLAALATTGRDIKFDLGRVEGYRNFCNKLWNAARYVLMNTEGQDCGAGDVRSPDEAQRNPGASPDSGLRPASGLPDHDTELSLADRWIVSRLQGTITQTRTQLDNYRFDLAAQALYEFTWYDYCDWYLELCKPVLTGDASDAAKRGTRRTLVNVLETLLRLMHPLMPFITETIWRRAAPLALNLPSPSGAPHPLPSPSGGPHPLPSPSGRGAGGEGGSKSIMDRPYPEADATLVDANAETDIRWVQDFVLGLRRIRAEMDISPGKALPVLIQNWSDADRARFDANAACLKFLARPESVVWLGDEQAPESAIALVGEMKILIPLAGLIDKDAEIARLEKEIAKFDKNLGLSKAKLDNPSFAERAPAEVVEKERARVAEMETARGELETQLERIRRM